MKGINWIRTYLQSKTLLLHAEPCTKFESQSWFVSSRKRNLIIWWYYWEENRDLYVSSRESNQWKLYPFWRRIWGISKKLFTDHADPFQSDGTVVFEKLITDHITHSEINLTQGWIIQDAKVIGHTKDPSDETLGNIMTTHYSTTCYMTLSYLMAKSRNRVQIL